ncbi:MAG: paraquat-inducible protein A [Campylobacterota bacterium]|nr:paraquat-inducible protein A [Campylobacterota bacterium]
MKKIETACLECGIIIDVKDFNSMHQYSCPRCHTVFYRPGEHFNLVVSMVISSILFFLPTLFMPIMTLNIMGLTHSVTLMEAVWFFAGEGYLVIALIAVASGFVIPLLLLGLILMMIIPLKLGYPRKRIRTFFRLYEHLGVWAMAEVYLVSIFVAIVKLGGMAELTLDFGLYSFLFFLITFYIAIIWFNPHDLWNRHDLEE